MYLEWLNLQALMTAWRQPDRCLTTHNCMKAAWQLPYDCLTTVDALITKTEEEITHFFLVAGFPVPYIGILTDKGSFSSTISPILDYKYHKNIISLNKLPKHRLASCGSGSGLYSLDHVKLLSWLTWKAFSCSPWQTELGRAIFFSFWLVLATRNGFEEILKI